MKSNNTTGVTVAKEPQGVDGTIEVENASVVIESPIKDEGVAQFKAPVKFAPPVVLLADAKIKIFDTLTKAIKTLPKNETPDSIVSRIRPVLVPYWEQSGWVSGSWRATGVTVERYKINCPKCQGRKQIGRGKARRMCNNCFGSGQKSKSKDIKRQETGNIEAGFDTEFAANFSSDIDFKLSPTDRVSSRMLSESQLESFTSIPPKSFNPEKQGNDLVERLRSLMISNVKKSLSSYSRVEGISVTPDSSRVQLELNAFLYPAYVCWYKKGSKLRYVVCDGITGEVTLPSRVGSILWKFTKIVFGIVVGLMIIGLFAEKPIDKKQTNQNVVVSEMLEQPVSIKNNIQPKVIPPAVLTNDELVIAVNKLRDMTHALANAHENRLSKYNNDQTTQFGLGSETIRFEQRRDEKCGVIPKDLMSANDTEVHENFANDLLPIVRCHIDQNTQRLKDIN